MIFSKVCINFSPVLRGGGQVGGGEGRGGEGRVGGWGGRRKNLPR